MAERGYGWEKLISEMFCQEYWAERGLETHIARFHNIYGPNGTWFGGREKAPAAICRKVIEAIDRGKHQHRHLGRRHADAQLLLHRRLRARHRPDHALRRPDRHAHQPRLERTDLDQRPGQHGRRDRRREAPAHLRSGCAQGRRRPEQRQHVHPSVLDWEPHTPLRTGMEKTYAWIAQQYADRKAGKRVVKD